MHSEKTIGFKFVMAKLIYNIFLFLLTARVQIFILHLGHLKKTKSNQSFSIGNSNLSIASSVSQGIATDVALIAFSINVAPQQAGIKFQLSNHLIWPGEHVKSERRGCGDGELSNILRFAVIYNLMTSSSVAPSFRALTTASGRAPSQARGTYRDTCFILSRGKGNLQGYVLHSIKPDIHKSIVWNSPLMSGP